MPLDTTIDVTVLHSLGQAGAFDRVVRWLDSKRGQATPISTNIDHANHRITSISKTQGKQITLEIQVTGDAVELHSDPIDGGFLERLAISGVVIYQERTIHAELVEALKP